MSLSHDSQILASRAPKPSYVTLPPLPKSISPSSPTMLDFLSSRFPRIARTIWLERLQNGSIHDEHNRMVDETTPYRVNARLSYYREVKAEPRIPFAEQIVYEDEHILVADKPHFLPVTPAGNHVNECLLHRLITRTGNEMLVPAHRLDLDTAGLVLFSKRAETRKAYCALFSQGRIHKQYEAIATLPADPDKRIWHVQSRIEASGQWILHHNVAGEINARSRIELLERDEQLARFALSPITGKTHQLRLHMGLIGCQILHDRMYPVLLEKAAVDYSKPLQLLARELVFTDPVSGLQHHFESGMRLSAWPKSSKKDVPGLISV